MSDWIDVSIPLSPQTVCWPGDQRFEATRDCTNQCTVTSFRMSAHLGTHMDAPLHYFPGGASMDSLPLDVVIGPARVILSNEMQLAAIQPGERILLKTANSKRIWHGEPFTESYAHLTPGDARRLAGCKPALVGVDYLSAGGPGEEGAETHRILLGAGIWILEALNLNGVEPGNYELLCLPLKIVAVEGAPVRAVLRRTN